MGVTHDLMGFDHLGLGWVLWRVLDFVEDVLVPDVIIQLGFAFRVETEARNLHPTLPSVYCTHNSWASRHEFHDVIVPIQFVGELFEVVSLRYLEVNDQVDFVVEHAFTQEFLQHFVEMETCPAGAETCHTQGCVLVDVKSGLPQHGH